MNIPHLRKGGRLLAGYMQAYVNNKLGIVGPMQRLAISVTGRCNSRCITCNIWRTRPDTAREIGLEEIGMITHSRLYRRTGSVVVTGGEPFLRSDLADIMEMLSSNSGAEISVVTNGLLPGRIFSLVEETRRRGARIDKVALSLNGKPETHDLTRGIKGGYDRLIESARGLKRLGVLASFIYTITVENHEQLQWAYELAEELGMDINFYPETTSYRFDNTGSRRGLLDEQKLEVLRAMKAVFSRRKFYYFDDSTLYFVERMFRGEQVSRCYAGLQSAYIDWRGEVFPCEAISDGRLSMGNIKRKALDEIWTSPEARRTRVHVMKGKCQPCYLACEVLGSLRKEPVKVLKYALKRRIIGGNHG